jgi:outer membrane protein assembly factor BamB
VVLALISGSLLLFHSLHATSNPATHPHTSTPTATVATPQGMVIMLFTNGTIEAVRGVTDQHVWSYATGVGSLGDVNVPFYKGLSVQNHIVYAMAKNHVFVLNEDSGQLLWKKTFPVHFANVTPNDSQLSDIPS